MQGGSSFGGIFGDLVQVDVRSPVQQFVDGGDVARQGSHPHIPRLHYVAHYRSGADRPPVRQVHNRDDGRHPQQERQTDAEQTVFDEAFQPPAPPQHGGEKTAHQEKDRHAEPVHRHEELVEGAGEVGHVVLHRPETGEESEGGVQADAQQHGEGPQGVQPVQTAGGRRLGGFGSGREGGARFRDGRRIAGGVGGVGRVFSHCSPLCGPRYGSPLRRGRRRPPTPHRRRPPRSPPPNLPPPPDVPRPAPDFR